MKPFRPYFIRFARERYAGAAEEVIAVTDKNYAMMASDVMFAAKSKNPMDRRLDFSAYFLAFIKTLDERGESFEQIRKICLDITTEYVQPRNKVAASIKKLIPRLITTRLGRSLIQRFHKRVSTNENEDGFVASIVTDPSLTYGLGYGVDILECGICKLFKKHNYERWASILCEVDKITTSLAGLDMIRSGTIANGAVKCDFRYRFKV